MDIKDFILIGGGLLIAAVVAHGFWIAWRARRDPLRIELIRDHGANDGDIPDHFPSELPNGGARVIPPGEGTEPGQTELGLGDFGQEVIERSPPASRERPAADPAVVARREPPRAKTEPKLGPTQSTADLTAAPERTAAPQRDAAGTAPVRTEARDQKSASGQVNAPGQRNARVPEKNARGHENARARVAQARVANVALPESSAGAPEPAVAAPAPARPPSSTRC